MPPHRSCEIPSALLTEWIAAGYSFVAELTCLHDVEYVDLPPGTGSSSPGRPSSAPRFWRA
ncbi:hypothetical protein [Cryobacterium sp. TMT2-14]|uniref:hypothetical protein n=1 Tax=Cryobacterium sp. TMT2-14 TaxID=1259245 RepID=UPI00106B830D|nr:hypothetical protein E3O28_05430 [Cryobacterium sp. TMT2-14]